MASRIEQWKGSLRTMTGGRLLDIALGAAVPEFVLINVPDIIRYIRITNM
jgi:hypothetical protein